MCTFWNETGEILPFLLLLDCFCDAEKADRTRAEATAHPQDNHQIPPAYFQRHHASQPHHPGWNRERHCSVSFPSGSSRCNLQLEEQSVPLPLRANTKRYVSIFMGWCRNNGVSSVLKRVLSSGKFIWQNCYPPYTPSPADTLIIAGMGLQSIGGNTEILNVAHVDS